LELKAPAILNAAKLSRPGAYIHIVVRFRPSAPAKLFDKQSLPLFYGEPLNTENQIAPVFASFSNGGLVEVLSADSASQP
jgi:hypothetical protein